jgi:uncharacterized protein (DUF58 family)
LGANIGNLTYFQAVKELLQKLRKFEIEIRKAVDSRLNGNFNSLFKGAGLEFDDVRSYQYGDDIRSIDWNVSSKGHGLFVKTFREDKQQTVFFLLDVSSSQTIGIAGQRKLDIAREICGVLTLSAIKEGGLVGLFAFSDKKEKYIKPGKGLSYAYQIIRSLFNYEPEALKTSLNNAILFALKIIKRKSVVIIVSDFIDTNYQNALGAMARTHDLVIIHLFDPDEQEVPAIGIIPAINPETGAKTWINTSSLQYRRRVRDQFMENLNSLNVVCRKEQVNMISVNVREDYLPNLIELFKVKRKARKQSTVKRGG